MVATVGVSAAKVFPSLAAGPNFGGACHRHGVVVAAVLAVAAGVLLLSHEGEGLVGEISERAS